MLRYLLTLLAAAGLPFASAEQPVVSSAQRNQQDDIGRLQYEAKIVAIVERLAYRCVVRGDQTLDLLLLSGGGSTVPTA